MDVGERSQWRVFGSDRSREHLLLTSVFLAMLPPNKSAHSLHLQVNNDPECNRFTHRSEYSPIVT